MAGAGIPGLAATTTATPNPTTVIPMTTPSPTQQSDILVRFDPDYFKTVPGIVKIAQIGLSLLGFIFIQASLDRSAPRGKYYSWISMISILFSGTLLGLYVFHVVEKYQHKVPWLKIELYFCGMWTILFVVASSLTIDQWGNNPFVAAGNVGIRSSVAYGVDFYLKWGALKRGNLPQQRRVEYQLPPAVNVPVIAIVGSTTI